MTLTNVAANSCQHRYRRRRHQGRFPLTSAAADSNNVVAHGVANNAGACEAGNNAIANSIANAAAAYVKEIIRETAGFAPCESRMITLRPLESDHITRPLESVHTITTLLQIRNPDPKLKIKISRTTPLKNSSSRPRTRVRRERDKMFVT